MSKRKGPNQKNLEETRQLFLEIAQTEFLEHGFADASTSRIVEESGMARGSLYYHFGDKKGLFKAVYEKMIEESSARVDKVLDKYDDPWDALVNGCIAILDIWTENDVRKITLIQCQTVLSHYERLQVVERAFLSKFAAKLHILMKLGYFANHTPKTAITFLLGFISEIGRSFDYSENLTQDKKDYQKALLYTLHQIGPPQKHPLHD